MDEPNAPICAPAFVENGRLNHTPLLLSHTHTKEENNFRFTNNMDDGKYHSAWNFPENLKFSNNIGIAESPNGLINLAIKENDFSWTLLSTPIEEYISYDYGIPEVLSTYLPINSTILLSTDTISITYSLPISNSKRNIRESIPAYKYNDFTYGADFKTMFINVLSSTFNQANANYTVVADGDAVKSKSTNQPIMGIEKGYWKFRTEDYSYKHVDDTNGKMALTPERVKYYHNFTFILSTLRLDLASIIPKARPT